MSRNGDFQSSDESGDFNKNDNNAILSPSSHGIMEKDMQVEDFFPYEGNTSQYAAEMSRLQHSNKQLKVELQAEQDNVLQLRKRQNQIEKQKLEATTQRNSEISSLETQLAKLRSQLEKGEAARHNLEYELTKSQREANSIRENAKRKELLLNDGTDELKKKMGDLSDEVQKLKKSLQTCQTNTEENEHKSRLMIEETVLKLSKTETEMDLVKTEKDRLNDLCQKHSVVVSELNEKLQEYESDKRNVIDNLRRATAELEYAKEREERLKSEFEGALSRIKSLEEVIEAERAAHLETKFNSEIVQLRVRDLDGAIDVEKSANTEANKAIERITKQNRELERVYDEERKNRKEINMKMDKLEKEYMSVRRQLSTEVDDKKAIIGNLSKELGSHQKNFNELKSELSKAKKRQSYLEETYGGSIKELEFLLKTFHFDDKRLKIATRKDDTAGVPGTTTKGTKPANPSVVVENFKQMLIHLKKRLDTQNDDLIKAKKNAERLNKDLDSSREIIKSKDKTLEDTQKNYTKAARDLNKARANYAELETSLNKLKASLQANTSSQDKDKLRIQELSEEIMRLVKRHQGEEEEKLAFLHGLYQRLLSSPSSAKSREKVFNQFSWSELTVTVYEQVSELVDLLHDYEVKLTQTHDSARNKEDAYVSKRNEHEEQISKLTNMAREREASWQRQKHELEQHYNELLSDLQARSKKTQAIADQAWEKVRATGSVQQGLETEVVELRRELAESQVQASSLLSACTLLSGALYPLYTKSAMLSSQCHVLDDLFSTWENCRDRALYLSSVLSSGKDSDQDQPERDSQFSRKGSLLLRFRVGVIAVLAANRLAFLGSTCSRCFVTYNSHVSTHGIQVSTGGLDLKNKKIGAFDISLYEQTTEQTRLGPMSKAEKGLVPWLKNSEFLEIVVGSMTELQEALRVNKDDGDHTEMKLVVTAARSAFSKFMDRLAYFFPSPTLPIHSSLRERSSLLRNLERHLSRLLIDTPQHAKGSLVSSQEIMSSLQNHILDLTQRLHAAEKERRHLLSDLNELKNQIGDEIVPQENTKEKSEKGTKYVAKEKFEKICVELSSALRREQKAQSLLQEQSSQLSQLTSKLDMCVNEEMQMQNRLVQTDKNMTDFQQQLRHKDQNLRQIGKQLAQIEYEREAMSSNLKDAETALRNAVRDKEILAHYIRSIEGALDTAKNQFLILQEPAPLSGEVSLSHLLLNAELIPSDIGKAGPELIAVQNLVGAFVDAQHQAVNKIRSLEEEIISHKKHIESLKKELSNAVQREFSDQIDVGNGGIHSTPRDMDKNRKELYLPLKEDSDVSFESLPSSSKPVAPFATSMPSSSVQQSQKSAFHLVSSSASFSPRKSPRT